MNLTAILTPTEGVIAYTPMVDVLETENPIAILPWMRVIGGGRILLTGAMQENPVTVFAPQNGWAKFKEEDNPLYMLRRTLTFLPEKVKMNIPVRITKQGM